MKTRRAVSIVILVAFIATSIKSPAYAQSVLNLPAPGTMVSLSPIYTPVLIKGLKLNPKNPLALDFIVETGNTGLTTKNPQFKTQSEKLIKYFFAALTLPEKDMWVNLSPYEKNRVIPKATGETEMGRDMLAQDYLLKQITASLIYPEKALGKEFWNKVYSEAAERFGSTQIPVNTFNKVWIVAQKATVFEAKDTVFVINSHLKVMLEEDYLALNKHQQTMPVNDTHALGSQIVREIVLPALEKEVNEGKNFASLRQIFYSVILAKWYKETLKTALLNQVYSNKNIISGVDVADKSIKEKIYQQYLKAYKKGVFNFIKEDIDQASKQLMPRKYFSGGEEFDRIELERVNAGSALPAMLINIKTLIVGTIALVSSLATTGFAQSAVSQGTNEVAHQLSLFNKLHPETYGFVNLVYQNFGTTKINVLEAKERIGRGNLIVEEKTGNVTWAPGVDAGYASQMLGMSRDQNAGIAVKLTHMTEKEVSQSRWADSHRRHFNRGYVFISNVGIWLPAYKVEGYIRSGVIDLVPNGDDFDYELGGVSPEKALGKPEKKVSLPTTTSVVSTNVVPQAIQDQLDAFRKYHPEQYGFVDVEGLGAVNVWEIRELIGSGRLSVDNNGKITNTHELNPSSGGAFNAPFSVNFSWNRYMQAQTVGYHAHDGKVGIANVPNLSLPVKTVQFLVGNGNITEWRENFYLGGMIPAEARNDRLISELKRQELVDIALDDVDEQGKVYLSNVDISLPIDEVKALIRSGNIVRDNGRFNLVGMNAKQASSLTINTNLSVSEWETGLALQALKNNYFNDATNVTVSMGDGTGVHLTYLEARSAINHRELILENGVLTDVSKGHMATEVLTFRGLHGPVGQQQSLQLDSFPLASINAKEIQAQLDTFNKYHPEEYGFVDVDGLGPVNVWEIREHIKIGTLSVDNNGKLTITHEFNGPINAPFSVNYSFDREIRAENVGYDAKHGRIAVANEPNLTLPVHSVQFLIQEGDISYFRGTYNLGGMIPAEAKNEGLITELEKQAWIDSLGDRAGDDGQIYLDNVDISLSIKATTDLIRSGNITFNLETGRFNLVGMTAKQAKEATGSRAMIVKLLSTWALVAALFGTVYNDAKASDASTRGFKKALQAQSVDKLFESINFNSNLHDDNIPDLKTMTIEKFRKDYLFTPDEMKKMLEGRNPQDVYNFINTNIPTQFVTSETWASYRMKVYMKLELLRLVTEAGGLDQKVFRDDVTSNLLTALNDPNPIMYMNEFVNYLQSFYNWDDMSASVLARLQDSPKSLTDGTKWLGGAWVRVVAQTKGIEKARRDFGPLVQDMGQPRYWQSYEIDVYLQAHVNDKGKLTSSVDLNLQGTSPYAAPQVASTILLPGMAAQVLNPNLNGGIDLNDSKIAMTKEGSGMDIEFNPAIVAQFRQGRFNRVVPIITGIKTIANIYPLLDLKTPSGG